MLISKVAAGDRKIWSRAGCRMSDNSEDLEEQKDATQLSQAGASVGSSSVAFDEDTLKEVRDYPANKIN